MQRRWGLAVVVVAVATTGMPSSRAGTPWDACPSKTAVYGDHVTVQEPAYGRGPRSSESLAVDPADLARLAVANGRQVVMSDDAGCTWADAFPATRPGDGGIVTAVAREGDRVRATVSVLRADLGVTRAYGLRLLARDATAERTHDLPPDLVAEDCTESSGCFVRFAPGRDLRVAYAAAPGTGVAPPRLAVTTDGGDTWVPRMVPSRDHQPLVVTDLAVDPADDAHVIAVAGGAVHRSHDRGESWTSAPEPTGLSRLARVTFGPDGALVLDGAVHRSRHRGPFVPTGAFVPGDPLRDAAVGPSPAGPVLFVAAGGALSRQAPDGTFQPLLRSNAGVSDIAPTTTGVWVRRTGSLGFVSDTTGAVRSPRVRPRFDPPPAGTVNQKPPGGRLYVDGAVEVPPDGFAMATVGGDLARQPRGLDVFFLMDTTGSMAAKIHPMAVAMASVVDTLNRQGISARFGLGEYGSFSYRYRRHADLGTPPAEVQQKLLLLSDTGGDELHHTSFHQLATGAGLSQVTVGGTVPPGQQASFQPGALHIVVHATDDINTTDPDGPLEHEALAALNAVDVRHVGIYPYDLWIGVGTWQNPILDNLRHYAERTSAFTPRGGLDCDGDGRVDLQEGDPIACAIPGATSANAPIATLLERVLLSLSGAQPVAVVPRPTPLAVAVRSLDDYRAVDLHEPHEGLEWDVEVRCPAAQQGSTVDLGLDLQVGGVTVASGVLPVTCLAHPKPAREAPEQPFRKVLPRPPVGLPVATPSPVALAQSVATAQAQATSSASAQAAQVGMAIAPDDAAQLAREEEDDSHFVAHTRSAPAPVGAAAVVFALALGLLYAVRPRVATQPRSSRW